MLLVCQSPQLRPSAKDLLSDSSLLPTRVGLDKTYLKEVTDALLSNTNKDVSAEIISVLFRRRDAFFDNDSPIAPVKSKLHGSNANQRAFLEQSFRNLAQLHGAIEFSGSLLNYNCERDSQNFNLLEPSGRVVCLPDDLVSGYATYAARAGIVSSVRYNIGRVFEASSFNLQPIEHTEACFDILSSDPSSAPLLQAQALVFINSFLTRLQSHYNFTYTIRLGDGRLAASILDLCGVSDQLSRDKLVQLMSPSVSRKDALSDVDIFNQLY